MYSVCTATDRPSSATPLSGRRSPQPPFAALPPSQNIQPSSATPLSAANVYSAFVAAEPIVTEYSLLRGCGRLKIRTRQG